MSSNDIMRNSCNQQTEAVIPKGQLWYFGPHATDEMFMEPELTPDDIMRNSNQQTVSPKGQLWYFGPHATDEMFMEPELTWNKENIDKRNIYTLRLVPIEKLTFPNPCNFDPRINLYDLDNQIDE